MRMRVGGEDRLPPSACSQQSNQSSPNAYPGLGGRGGGEADKGGRVLSQDIPHIPSLLLRPNATNPASKRPASAERLLPTLIPTQDQPSSRTPKWEAAGRTLYGLLSSGALIGGGWREKEYPPSPRLHFPHPAPLTESAAPGQGRTAKVVEDEKEDPLQGTHAGHLMGHGPLLRAMYGEPPGCRSKPEGSPRRGFQLRGAPQSEERSCLSSGSPEFDEGDSPQDSREGAVLSLTYTNKQIKTRKFKGKAL